MGNEYELFAEKKFRTQVRSETMYGIRADYGDCENEMRLVRAGNSLVIEWDVFNGKGGKEAIDGAEIGIVTVGKKVIDYDGVFELPKEAIELLKEYGLDTSEVEEKDD